MEEEVNKTIVTKDNVYTGMRVVRGRDWMHADQDSNGEGTVVKIDKNDDNWWYVLWDNGHQNTYRVGARGYYDLYSVDESFEEIEI